LIFFFHIVTCLVVIRAPFTSMNAMQLFLFSSYNSWKVWVSAMHGRMFKHLESILDMNGVEVCANYDDWEVMIE